jgi:hypothetical protein
MIDVNKITSVLAKLPDQQLQQYAQMHKADPYIMALAMSESNRRKELRSAGQGAQGMQEQPKVVDSEIAQMLPEDQGIGQLNAGDMNFAGGGIIAFADGGDVERYQSGGSIAAQYQQESMEMGMGNTPGFDFSLDEFCSDHNNANRKICQDYFNLGDSGELGERLYGNQKRIDKNKNGRIDREDFKLLRKEMYELTLDDTNETFIFTENEIIGIIENVILEEKKKSKSKTKSKNPIKLTKDNQEKSKKENDDNIDMVVKKMKNQLKNQSKGEYEMNPKHFPKGNGELAKMDKMAYVPSNAVDEYIKNFTAAGLENLYFGDGIKPDEEWMTDNIEGSSRTGNNPEWANAVETPVNKERNTIRKNNLLNRLKQKAYNKSAQPVVSDNGGSKSDKASKIMMNLESTESKKVLTDVDKMKSLMGYSKNTQ